MNQQRHSDPPFKNLSPFSKTNNIINKLGKQLQGEVQKQVKSNKAETLSEVIAVKPEQPSKLVIVSFSRDPTVERTQFKSGSHDSSLICIELSGAKLTLPIDALKVETPYHRFNAP